MFVSLIIYVIVPLLGFIYYQSLQKKMLLENIENPPVKELLAVFISYTVLIVVLLTLMFWRMDGVFVLCALYAIFGGPVVMGVVAFRLGNRRTSKYHALVFWLSVFYFVPVTSLALYMCISMSHINF